MRDLLVWLFLKSNDSYSNVFCGNERIIVAGREAPRKYLESRQKASTLLSRGGNHHSMPHHGYGPDTMLIVEGRNSTLFSDETSANQVPS